MVSLQVSVLGSVHGCRRPVAEVTFLIMAWLRPQYRARLCQISPPEVMKPQGDMILMTSVSHPVVTRNVWREFQLALRLALRRVLTKMGIGVAMRFPSFLQEVVIWRATDVTSRLQQPARPLAQAPQSGTMVGSKFNLVARQFLMTWSSKCAGFSEGAVS